MSKKVLLLAIFYSSYLLTLVSCVSSNVAKSDVSATEAKTIQESDGKSCVYINKNQVMNINGALQFNVMQCNRVTIASGVDSVDINNFPYITPNTLIVITPQSPHSEGFYQYWVEPENESFTVNIEPASADPWTFNFFISRY